MKIVILLVALVVASCAAHQPVTDRNNQLTHGNVQMNLEVGVTTQAQVLEVFGAPNITTIDSSGQEVWTYQRHATVAQATGSSNYWTVVLVGGASGSSGFERSSRTITLIIKFDESNTVVEFNSRASNF